jgi:hypothetical protein
LEFGLLVVSQYEPTGQQDRAPHRPVPDGQMSSTRAQPWIISRFANAASEVELAIALYAAIAKRMALEKDMVMGGFDLWSV